LNCDMSHLLSDSATDEQRQIAATLCHIGQPVKVRHPLQGAVGTLRISASAGVVSETWSASGEAASAGKINRRLDRAGDQVERVLDKIGLLVENLDALSDAAVEF
jgi:hypothetical protein